ncbi:MAG: PTS sugar transporter subunit IIC [Erysipelotrichaceae bacterium]|nr:PTS sugar transporter subunit IIC [Erysipelotrichaceae bacterium]
MQITLMQAILITVFSVLSNLMFPLFGDIGGYFCLGRPLIAGTIVGVILGDVKTGMLIGATLNAVYMNSQAVGNVMSTDVTMAGYTATALAMAGGSDTAMALALSIPIGIFGALLFTAQNAVCVFVCHWCDKFAEKGDTKKMWLYGIIIPAIIFNAIRFITTFPVIYYGAQYSSAIEAWMPEVITNAMGVVGGMLPAVGMALLLKVMVTKPSHWCFFMIGFVALSVLGLGTVPLTIIAVALAVILDEVRSKQSPVESLDSLDSLE